MGKLQKKHTQTQTHEHKKARSYDENVGKYMDYDSLEELINQHYRLTSEMDRYTKEYKELGKGMEKLKERIQGMHDKNKSLENKIANQTQQLDKINQIKQESLKNNDKQINKAMEKQREQFEIELSNLNKDWQQRLKQSNEHLQLLMETKENQIQTMQTNEKKL